MWTQHWTVFTLPGYTQHGGKVNWDGEYSGNCSGFNHALICHALTRHQTVSVKCLVDRDKKASLCWSGHAVDTPTQPYDITTTSTLLSLVLGTRVTLVTQ